ncbi:SLC13/DASS family transporter [Verrucomicrobiaceae bacterium R5-34]|uniref:SLC13/DASS family transporter n=1 Tax=Oceaniferula flava TaxID=2800421 RepID=A0AAE2SBK7_9BACT|nr:SLC13 family permease [Oceaniferula flavus]MBK1829243.1 SLC13/DASS family transporter [Verrucomicrobiaceae bacterium R5-34]MBK1853480.1 SLC13/DASS family transporter [Oceaniferula flavus]MBM1134785.1 SLC13/DASS family transporter [Oceaniferula flavus]
MHKDPSGERPDTRAVVKRMLGQTDRHALASIVKFFAGITLGLLAYFLPEWLGWQSFESLSPAGRVTLGIMIGAAFLWVTEAIPAFAVGVLVIAVEIAVLGKPGGVYAAEGDNKAWTEFVGAWSSSIMWLFLGGFVLAQAASKTRLDQWMASRILGVFGKNPAYLLASTMAVTFVFSMFMSNTATAAMMITVAAPVLSVIPKNHSFGRSFILSVPVAANLGGIATIIGTPPNAIAVGSLSENLRPDFIQWMAYGLPPALLLASLAYLYLFLSGKKDGLHFQLGTFQSTDAPPTKDENKQRFIVAAVLLTTVLAWMTESLHNIPAPVVSFLPITAFAVTGVLASDDMRNLPWDVLLLLAGGISLGGAVKATGLAAWIGSQVPASLPLIGIIIVISLIGVVMSNLMSNTATASILVPVGIGIVASHSENAPAMLAIPLAIACSCAMCLPISTPPNAVALASGKVQSRDFMKIGLIMAAIGPVVGIVWLQLVL